MATLRQALSLILSSLLLFPQTSSAQSQPQSPSFQTASQAASQVPLQGAKADPKRARKAAEQGEKAEAAGRLQEALAAFEEAARYSPQDIQFAAHAEQLRSKMVRGYADAAERDALAGNLGQATEDLAAALVIDPANAAVMERLRQLKSMENDEGLPKAVPEISGIPRLKPQAGKRNLDLHGDTRTVYEQLANMFGVRATFDPDLIVKNVRLNVDAVDFQNAVTILAAATETFWRPMTDTLMFVAADTPDKRRQYDLEAEQTFPLSSAISSEDATEVLRILRDITAATHMDLDSRSHSITMRDTPQRLALAGALIQQIERARGELMLEIELLEVDRNTARKLGIEPPTSHRLISIPSNLVSQISQAKNLGDLESLLAGIFGTSASSATSISSLIPPIAAIGGGKSTFLLTLPSAAADFSDALSLVQSGRQVLLRAQDGKPATFFVGQRFPITLSLLSGSLGNAPATPNPSGASNPFPSTSFAAGKGPVALAAADFRNNGSLDLAAVNEIDNSVTVLLNQGGSQGTFAQATGSPILLGTARAAAPATHPGIASATFTNSGCHDLVVSDPLANQVDVLLSNCDGTFQKPVAVPAGSNPTAIATGDFNGDGHQDFAVVNEDGDSVSVFLGDGTGKFTAATGSPFVLAQQLLITTTSLSDAVSGSSYSATLQSIGGTGAVTWTATGLPSWLTLNSGTGVMTGTPPSTAVGTPITIGITAKDSANPPNTASTALNITVHANAPTFAISTASLPNGTVGTPYDQVLTATGGVGSITWSPSSLGNGLSLNSTTGEITGTPTIATGQPASFTFTVTATDSSSPTPLTAQKQFTLTPIPATATQRGPVAIVQNDFNADGNQDLAIVNQTTGNVTVLLGKGDGTFSEATGSPISSGVGKGPVAIAAGDLNGDGKPDLAVVNQTDNSVSVLLNNGDATFTPATGSPLQTAASPTGVAIADFNQDGLADIAVTNGGANTFSVFLGLSGGLFTQAFQPPPAGPAGSTPTAIVAGTFATGAFPDVAITNDVSGTTGDITVVLSPASLFSNGVAPGVLQQPYPASEYVDLGVKIKATPTLHPNSEVTLQLEFEIRALAGASVNGIPILSNRTLSQTVRVKENEPTLVTGMTDREETRSIAGLPGFAEIPGIRYAFSSKSQSLQDTELLIVVTPRRLRLADHLTRTIYAGRGEVGRTAAPGFRGTPGLPAPQPQPPPQQPQPQPLPPLQQPPLPQQQPQQQPQPQR